MKGGSVSVLHVDPVRELLIALMVIRHGQYGAAKLRERIGG